MPGGLVEYRQNLVQEARSTGVRTVRRSFEEIEADMKGKGWNGRKALKKFVRDVMDQANKDLQEGIVAPTQVIPDSKEEAFIYERTRKNQAVPSMEAIINKLAVATGRVLKGLKEARTQIRTDKETLGYISTLRSIRKNAETQLATDLGITNPETISFTADLDDEMRIPNRVTTTVSNPGTLSNVEGLVVESPNLNATQDEVEQTLMDNRTKVRAYIATLPDGSYEINDGEGNVVGTLVIERPTAAAPAAIGEKAAKNLPKIQRLIDKKDEVDAKIRLVKARLRGGLKVKLGAESQTKVIGGLNVDFGPVESIEAQPISEYPATNVVRGEAPARFSGTEVTFEGREGVINTEPFVGRISGVTEVVVEFPETREPFAPRKRESIPLEKLDVGELNKTPLEKYYLESPLGITVNELNKTLATLTSESLNLEKKLNSLIDKTRQQVINFAETATSPDPNPELLATPPSTEGSLADYATFTDIDGNEGILFDAIEYLSGNLDTTFEDVFVNDSEITARQLDQGRTLTIPAELRERVAPGITFDPETGVVTSAVSAINGGTRVSAPGQLETAAKEAQTIMDTNFRPVPEEKIDLADIIQGIVRDPKTNAIIRVEKPLTKEQVAQIELADGLISRYEANANVDEDRVVQIARIIFARTVRDGKSITPRRALDQAAKKLLDRQKYRPKMLSTEAPVGGTENVFLGERLSVADIVEQFEGSQPEGFSEAGYADEPSLGRVEEGTRNMLDYDELVYRQVTLRHARLFAADPELNKGSEVYVKEHSREMLTLRRRLAKEGKLRGFTQEEISNFTMSILRDLDKRPLRDQSAYKNYYSADTTFPFMEDTDLFNPGLDSEALALNDEYNSLISDLRNELRELSKIEKEKYLNSWSLENLKIFQRLEQIVDQIAAKAGYTQEAWRGTESKEFAEILEPIDYDIIGGIFTGKDIETALFYGDNIKRLLVRSSNPYTALREYDAEIDEVIDAVEEKYRAEGTNSQMDASKVALDGYDSIDRVNELIVFDPSQIKDGSVITFDENGDVVPLTQRFNKSQPQLFLSIDNQTPISTEESGRALRLIREVIAKHYPGIREVIVTDARAKMHVNSSLSRTLFANPQRVARTIRNMDDNQAFAFIRSLSMHEYFHLGLLRKIGVKGLLDISKGLTDAQLDQTADMYFSRTIFESEEQRIAAYKEFKKDRVGATMEFITMMAERMKRGESVQEMQELTGMPKNILQRILAAIKTVWRKFETYVSTMRNPALREQLDNLFAGVRELDELTYGESVYPERNPELREAPAQYSEQVGRIFESYKADTRKSYEVSLPGNPKTGTLAQNPEDAVRRVIARYIRDNGSVVINGQKITNIGAANSEIARQGSTIKFAKLTVPKAEQTLAKATAKPDANGQLVQGDFEFYSYSPDTRVRMGLLGQEKGGFWQNLKSIFTGRYSETRSKVGGFGSSGKFAPDQRDVRIRQAAKINADIAKADFLVSKYKRVIKKVYKNKDIPIDLINTALGSTENKYTDDQYRQLQNAVDEDTRAALVRQFMEQNLKQSKAKILDAQNQLPKELSSVLVEMRQNLIDLSNKLIAGGYLTEQMKMVVEANKEVYLHRSYQIFDNPEWKALMEKPEPGSEQERILNAADRLFRSKVQADIARDLRNEAARSGLNMSVTRSLEIAARYKDDIAIKAHNMLIDYLSVADDRENNFLLTGTLPGQRKLDIIKVRGQIPKEIRELWGEIQNNETNFVKSVAKISAFMATTDTARDLLDLGIKQNYIWKKGLSREPSPPAGFRPIYPPGTVGEYNPLNDAFAPQEVREAFRSLKDVNTMQGWAKWFSGLTAWSMASKTIGNFPQGYSRNFLSNPLLVVNGGFVEGMDLLNPMQMMRNAKLAYRAALANTGLSFNEAIQAKRNEYISEGVVGDNVESSLFREMIETSMSEPGIPSLWQETKGKKNLKQQARMATGTAKRFFEKMADIYQGIDDFWKVFAYEQEKKFQKRTHPNWDETKIRREAATRVRNKLPTYSLSPEITKTVRRAPFIAPFITWTSEIIRTGANTFAIAAEDIRVGRETNNKEMIKNGMRSLKGALFSAALIPTAVATSKAISGYDEEADEAIRQFVPDFEKNDQLLYIGERENGRASYLNLSYLDPQNMRAETAIAFYRAIRGESGVGEAFLDAATQMLQPLLSEQLFAGAVMDLARNRTTLGTPIWNEQDSPTNITLAKLSHLAKALSPGVITGVGTRVYRAATGQVTRQGRSYDLSNELAAAGFGQRVSEIDAQTMLGNKVKKFLSGRSEATQLLTRVLNSRGTIDIGNIPDAYRRANEAYVRLYEDMKKSYDSALLLGVPKQQAIRIISGAGTSRGLSDKDTLAIISGRFPQLRLSKPTLDVTLTATTDRAENLARRKAYLEAVQSYNTQN